MIQWVVWVINIYLYWKGFQFYIGYIKVCIGSFKFIYDDLRWNVFIMKYNCDCCISMLEGIYKEIGKIGQVIEIIVDGDN